MQDLLFPDLCSRTITVDCSGGNISSDGGVVLLAQTDRSFGIIKRLASCFTDHRDQDSIEHSVLELLRQRIYGLALGFEDLNDHDQLCRDPLLASVCGKKDPTGQDRLRPQDKGKALAGKSTLNRLELTPSDASASSRYKKIAANETALENYFIDEWIRTIDKDASEVWLDMDRTDDPVYGRQEGRFFHGYYDEYCYTPFYIFCGGCPVVAALHTADSEHLDEILRLISKVVERARAKHPGLRIVLRGDSGFCRERLMIWCEENQVDYLFGLARNAVLERMLRGTLRGARSMLQFNRTSKEKLYKDLRYRARSWSRKLRRVVGKAEVTPEEDNPRFVITSLGAEHCAAAELYEKKYCARGDMENRIKEQKLDLFAGRTSTGELKANQLRVWLSTAAYHLMNTMRRAALQGTELARAECGTIRSRLLKIGALVEVTVRRVWVRLSSAHPLQHVFELAARRLVAASG